MTARSVLAPSRCRASEFDEVSTGDSELALQLISNGCCLLCLRERVGQVAKQAGAVMADLQHTVHLLTVAMLDVRRADLIEDPSMCLMCSHTIISDMHSDAHII